MPPLAPPTAPKPSSHLVLVPCAQAYAFKESNAAGFGDNLVTTDAPGLAITVACNGDSPIDLCGAEGHAETVLLDEPDAWAERYGNQAFSYDAANQSISIHKSGKCLGAASHTTGAKVSLAMGGGVIKCPPSSARAQSQLWPYISLSTCRWRRALNGSAAHG